MTAASQIVYLVGHDLEARLHELVAGGSWRSSLLRLASGTTVGFMERLAQSSDGVTCTAAVVGSHEGELMPSDLADPRLIEALNLPGQIGDRPVPEFVSPSLAFLALSAPRDRGSWYGMGLALRPGRSAWAALRLRREPGGRIACTALALEPRPRGELLSGDLGAVRLGDIVAEVGAAVHVDDHGVWRLLPVAGPGGVPLEERVPSPAAGGPS